MFMDDMKSDGGSDCGSDCGSDHGSDHGDDPWDMANEIADEIFEKADADFDMVLTCDEAHAALTAAVGNGDMSQTEPDENHAWLMTLDHDGDCKFEHHEIVD